jgi:sedoheptulokinase
MYFIGIDIGTSSICGVIYDPVNKAIESITKNNAAQMASPHPWEKIQNPAVIIETVTEIIEQFTSRYTDIQAIGITGQMHGILYLDKNGNAVSPLYFWQDGRGNLHFRDNQTYVEYLSRKTGHAVATGYGLVTHFYNQENRLLPDGAVKLCTIMDYAGMKLSGRKMPLTDYSNGASLGFFDLQNNCFDLQALEETGISPSILPETGESASLLGYYKQQIPVYSAIGDNQASLLGSVDDIQHSVHITVGTGSQISVYSGEFVKIESLDTRPFPGGGYILVGAPLCGGQAFALLKTFFGNTLTLFGQEALPSGDLYGKMTAIPFNNASGDLPVVETCFNSTRLDPCKKGKISNISTSNFTPENLISGFLNGIASELYHFYQLIPDEIKKDKRLWVASGNGLKKNPLLVQTLEAQFNCKFTLSEWEEEAAMGACLCGMRK